MKPFLLILAVVALVGCGKKEEPSPNAVANRLFVQAVKLVKSAEYHANVDNNPYAAAANKNPRSVIKDYNQALSNIRSIIDDHSGSDLLVKLVNGETLIGGMTIEQIELAASNYESKFVDVLKVIRGKLGISSSGSLSKVDYEKVTSLSL